MAKRIIWVKEAVADRIQILDYWYKCLGNKQYSSKVDNILKKLSGSFPIFHPWGESWTIVKNVFLSRTIIRSFI